MDDATAAYIDRLSHALRDLPRDLADGVVAGVREELSGLSEDAAAQRMAEMGDPEFIAASAHEELAPVARASEPPWYTILTAVLVAAGGILVPVVGWVVGVALLWNSTVWTRRDKIVGTLL